MIGIRTPRIHPDGAPTSGVGTRQLRQRPAPIIGTVGRGTAEVRLRVIKHTDKNTLVHHVHRYTDI